MSRRAITITVVVCFLLIVGGLVVMALNGISFF